MTRSGIEHRSPEPLANTQTIIPICLRQNLYLCHNSYEFDIFDNKFLNVNVYSAVILSSADSCRNIHMYIYIYIYIYWIHPDAMIKTHAGITDVMIKTQEDFFIKIFSSHFIARVRKGCSRFVCERELKTEHK